MSSVNKMTEEKNARKSGRETDLVRVDKRVLDAFRRYVVSRYGQLQPLLSAKATEALEEYMHRHREPKQQQQKEIAFREDVQENIDEISKKLYNDHAISDRVKGYQLGGIIQAVLGKGRDRRTYQSYARRLVRAGILKFVEGRMAKLGDEVYELV